jgi:hypothetical protein
MLPVTAIWVLNFETVEIRLEYPILKDIKVHDVPDNQCSDIVTQC